MLVVMAGLPGTGKSTLARSLAGPLHAVVLDKDAIRAALFPQEWIEFSPEQDDFVVRIMLRTANYLLEKDTGQNILLDGRPFSRRYQLEEVTDFARRLGIPWRVVECTCSQRTAEARIAAQDNHPAADRTVELYRRLRDSFEAIPEPKTVIDTEEPLAQCVQACLADLGRG